MDYVFVLDEYGVRQTSFVVGVHADTLEETEQLAKQSYPTSTILSGDSDMQSQFTNGKAYVNGEFVEPLIVEYIPTKEEKLDIIHSKFYQKKKKLMLLKRNMIRVSKR